MQTIKREVRDPDTDDRLLVGRLWPVHKNLLTNAMVLGDMLAVVGGTQGDEPTNQQAAGITLREASAALLRMETDFAKTDPPPRKKKSAEPAESSDPEPEA